MNHSNLINNKMECLGVESPNLVNTTNKSITCPKERKAIVDADEGFSPFNVTNASSVDYQENVCECCNLLDK